MRGKNIKINRIDIFLVIAIILGVFLHFRNFHEAVYLDPDEARPFALLNSGPMLYLICWPIYSIFQTEQSVFYVAACLGFAGIFIFYRICRLLFDRNIASYASIIYATFPFRINYARRLYPAVFIDFFLLLAIWLLCDSILSKKVSKMIGVGFFCTVLIFVHPYSYCMILAMAISVCYWAWTQRSVIKGKDVLKFCGGYVLGCVLGYFILDIILRKVGNGYVFIEQTRQTYTRNFRDVGDSWDKMLTLFTVIFKEMLFSPRTIFRSIFVISTLIFSIIFSFKNKQRNLQYVMILAVCGITIFLINALMGKHTIEYRHFVWICPVISLGIAYCLEIIMRDSKMWKRKLIGLCAVVFITTSVFESYMVTVETFKVDKIKLWLIKNNIKKNKVLTFLDLFSPEDMKDKCTYGHPPIDVHPECRPGNDRYMIVWLLIYIAYRMGKVEYIIPSGVGAHASLEKDDIMLKYVTPIQAWEHPYTAFKYRFLGTKLNKNIKPLFINVYRLADVFSQENVKYLGMNTQR